MSFKNINDKGIIDFIIKESKEINNNENIKLYLNKNNQVKDDLNEKNIESLLKFIVMNIDFEKNVALLYNFCQIQSLNDEIFKYILQFEYLRPEFKYYITANPSCSDDLKLNLLYDEKSDIYLKESILKKINNIDSLIDFSNQLEYHSSIISNDNLNNEMINIILDTIENNEEKNYSSLKNINTLLEKKQLEANQLDKIIDIALKSDSTYCLTNLAKQENITNNVVEKIMIFKREDETNSHFAREALIHNPNVDEKYKIEIIENQDKYPVYNINNSNPILDYLTKIQDFFNK